MKQVHDDSITCLRYLPDGNQLITNSKDHSLKVVDVRMFGVVRTIENENYYNSHETNQIGVSPTGRFVAVGSKNGKLILVNVDEGDIEEIYGNEHTTAIVGCDWSKRGGSYVATIDSIGNLFLWD